MVQHVAVVGACSRGQPVRESVVERLEGALDLTVGHEALVNEDLKHPGTEVRAGNKVFPLLIGGQHRRCKNILGHRSIPQISVHKPVELIPVLLNVSKYIVHPTPAILRHLNGTGCGNLLRIYTELNN